MSYLRLLPPVLVLVALVPACNGELATVDESNVPPASSPDGGGNGKPDSGSTFDGATTPTDGGTTNPSPLVCGSDQGCNSDPNVSALFGKCYEGICICQTGYHVQPNGKCAKTPPPDCMTQTGECFQLPATCPDGSLQGTRDANMSCGDLIEAVCCFAKCVGPADMICCDANQEVSRPICENGWQTCRPGAKPSAKKVGCP